MQTICLLPDSHVDAVRALSEGRVLITRRHVIEPLASPERRRREREAAARERLEAERRACALPSVAQPSPRSMGLLDMRALRRRRRSNLAGTATANDGQPSLALL